MPNEILFAGGGFETISTSFNASVSTTQSMNATYSDHTIRLDPDSFCWAEFLFRTGSNLALGSATTGETVWVHALVTGSGNFNPTSGIIAPLIELRDSSGFPWFGLRCIVSGIVQPMYNSGTGASPVWTAVGATFASAAETLNYDVALTLGSPHSVTVYKDNTAISTGTFTQALLTSLDRVRFGGVHTSAGATQGTGISQVLVTSNISTVGAIVAQSKGTADGANTGWTGAFSDVNEIGVNDATTQAAATAGLIETHVMSDITVPAGFEINTVFHWMRAKNDGTAPNNIRSTLRLSGANYAGPTASNIGLGYGPVGSKWTQAPNASNWTAANFNAIEFGYESLT